MAKLILLVVALGLCACPNSGEVLTTVQECESVATRCRLDSGGVGICTFDAESKLVCMSQH
ncbi:MAG: hypothetical protein H0U74_17830 [Bradymonadaceae bacterium]|nr:hypothetical protein [Lujinxingiaceae bacterium]